MFLTIVLTIHISFSFQSIEWRGAHSKVHQTNATLNRFILFMVHAVRFGLIYLTPLSLGVLDKLQLST